MLTMTYHGKRVLTTDQLATIFGTYVDSIRKNYHVNKDRFEEGQHCYTLTGAELKAFKAELSSITESNAAENRRVAKNYAAVELLEAPDDAEMYVPAPSIGKFANTLKLWTRRGLARHAKMLTTEQAWTAFERMEDVYFAVLEGKRQEAPPKDALTLGGKPVWTIQMVMKLFGKSKGQIAAKLQSRKFVRPADIFVTDLPQLQLLRAENKRWFQNPVMLITERGLSKLRSIYEPLETQQMTLFEAPPPGVGKLADKLLSSAKTMLDVGEFLTAVGNELKAKVG